MKTAAKRARTKQADAPVQQSANSKDAILAAALKAFARDGFGGASLPKIGKDARVAAPLIHYYFGTKENLWRETVDYSLGRLRREATTIRNATRSLAPLDQLRALVQAFTQFAAHWPDHFVMIMAEAGSESERFEWAQKNYISALTEDVQSILSQAMEDGLIKNVRTDQLAYILFAGILLYFTVNPALPKGKETPEKELDQLANEYTDLVFEMLLNGLSMQK